MIVPNIFRWLFIRKVIKMTTIDAIKNPNVTLIDVREPYELEIDGTVKNAINIPMGEISEKLDEIKQMPKPIVVFCRSGGRASSTLTFLNENGVDEIFNGGGFSDVNEVLTS